MSSTAAESRLTAAIEAVTRAARATRRIQSQLTVIRQLVKEDRSPVTTADYAAQALVIATLCQHLGEVRLIGEEESRSLREPENAALRRAVVEAVGAEMPSLDEEAVLGYIDQGSHDGSAGSYWTLDPVDGTKGFLRGGQYAISLALVEEGELRLGVLGCPALPVDPGRPLDRPDPVGTLFHASRGGGAWSRPLEGAEDARLPLIRDDGRSPLRICESVESGHSRHDLSARVVEALGGLPPLRLDSQCKYGVVARGQAHAYLRLPTRPGYVERVWDHAAGVLVATEAGMRVSDIDGRPLDFGHGALLSANRGVVCSVPRFHGPLVEAIARLMA
ncbi:MAG: 3'(2'),5'-bisphosphate nucleotidase [Gammaproteobacteria bacterium]|nr:MAG: 3'(2'),5'-bisphosphate nucleotidase [Gammaproteobacteria bacterium]